MKDYERIIAIKERSAGNDTVGDMWLETKSFDKNVPVYEIVEWASNATGKLIISVDQDTETGEKLPFLA